jgi:hypothetical protein
MKSSKKLHLIFVLFVSLLLSPVTIVNACSRYDSFKMNELFSADFIVRATAIKYIIPPNPEFTTSAL